MRVALPITALLAMTACADPCKDSGTVCTIAGDGRAGFNGDGLKAAHTQLYYPMDVTAEPGTDRIVVVDWNNERIRTIDDGVFQTVVGRDLPGDGAPDGSDRELPGSRGAKTALNHPLRSTFSPDGMLYIAAWHNHKIRRWDPIEDRVRIVVANTDPGDGSGSNSGFAGDEGPAEDALVWFPSSITFDDDGTYYFTDERNFRIRRVGTDGVITTVAGTGAFDYIDGPCVGSAFRFADSPTTPQPLPGGVVLSDGDRVLYVADTFNHVIRKVDLVAREVETIAGTGVAGFAGDGGPAADAQLSSPTDLAWAPDGRLVIADTMNHRVRAIDLVTGDIETLVGIDEPGDGDDGLLADESALNTPYGLGYAEDGALWLADTYNNKIKRVTP